MDNALARDRNGPYANCEPSEWTYTESRRSVKLRDYESCAKLTRNPVLSPYWRIRLLYIRTLDAVTRFQRHSAVTCLDDQRSWTSEPMRLTTYKTVAQFGASTLKLNLRPDGRTHPN